ncbi:MAG: SWIM zinc finger family protein [Gemmataceae bacterium]
MKLAYAGPSQVVGHEGAAALALYGNLQRPNVQLDGTLKHPLRFREAMSVLYAVVGSDYRYVPKDRSAYVAYLRLKRESANLGLWQAQQAYFAWLLRNDPLAFCILDPIISVHPDRILFEVFSKDEGTYAQLALERNALELASEPVCGTTNIDFSKGLFDSLQQMRSYRQTRLSIGRESVKVVTRETTEALEKQIAIPDSWLRGFLQVQSATTLPLDNFSLAPLDLYNLLRQLRMNGDRKGQRRGLRVELVPGEKPRVVLEPWESVLRSSADIYRGKVAKVVRVWGRRRLLLLRRLLPFVEQVDVHLLGSGLPSFWILRSHDVTITLGLTGFTAANWSQAVTFDLLLPRKTASTQPLETVCSYLNQHWLANTEQVAQGTGLQGETLLAALQQGCQQGRLMFDLACGVYRYRPVMDGPLELARLEYRNRKERVAHDLFLRPEAVRIISENRIPGSGLELTGRVNVTEDKRDYRPQLLLGDEGQVSKAECTCPGFRKQGLKDGPCPHLIALRIAWAEQEAGRARDGDPRQTVVVETRTYSKRDDKGEEVMQLSLERQHLKIRWGRAGTDLRRQMLRFNTIDEARDAYFARIDRLLAKGYLDATA